MTVSDAPRNFWIGLSILALAMALVGVFVARTAERDYGPSAGVIAIAAGFLTFGGLATAMYLSLPTGSSARDTRRLIGSILARTGIPLVAVVALAGWASLPLHVVFGMVLAYYLVGLSLETWFAVRFIKRSA